MFREIRVITFVPRDNHKKEVVLSVEHSQLMREGLIAAFTRYSFMAGETTQPIEDIFTARETIWRVLDHLDSRYVPYGGGVRKPGMYIGNIFIPSDAATAIGLALCALVNIGNEEFVFMESISRLPMPSENKTTYFMEILTNIDSLEY